MIVAIATAVAMLVANFVPGMTLMVYGLVIAAVLVTGLTFMNYTKSLVDQFTFVILLATLTILIPYTLSAAAQIMLLITDRTKFSVRRLTGSIAVAVDKSTTDVVEPVGTSRARG